MKWPREEQGGCWVPLRSLLSSFVPPSLRPLLDKRTFSQALTRIRSPAPARIKLESHLAFILVLAHTVFVINFALGNSTQFSCALEDHERLGRVMVKDGAF